MQIFNFSNPGGTPKTDISNKAGTIFFLENPSLKVNKNVT